MSHFKKDEKKKKKGEFEVGSRVQFSEAEDICTEDGKKVFEKYSTRAISLEI